MSTPPPTFGGSAPTPDSAPPAGASAGRTKAPGAKLATRRARMRRIKLSGAASTVALFATAWAGIAATSGTPVTAASTQTQTEGTTTTASEVTHDDYSYDSGASGETTWDSSATEDTATDSSSATEGSSSSADTGTTDSTSTPSAVATAQS